ncbi:carbonic anhydrase [Gemmatirosa kalamazoonensis]|uniref:carbonic anhydrase n=1 Tax=Gemmatirosa kalamazoonensis TaxID=861299 RepID=UPI0004B870B9|nr:carbonic anhydrase [Gemmatirosa kalamazoonensis]
MPSHPAREQRPLGARARAAEDPNYFPRLASQHRPHALFVGCSDARVPAEVITQATPGELFVHRNIANQAHPTDTNLNAALQYAVEALAVEDVVVCGHEGCGGVRAAMHEEAPPLVDTWVAGVRTIVRLHADELSRIPDLERRLTRLVELNVMEQVFNISRSPIVQSAWAAGRTLRVHGWVYGIGSGLLRDLGVTMDGAPLRAALGKVKAVARDDVARARRAG